METGLHPKITIPCARHAASKGRVHGGAAPCSPPPAHTLGLAEVGVGPPVPLYLYIEATPYRDWWGRAAQRGSPPRTFP